MLKVKAAWLFLLLGLLVTGCMSGERVYAPVTDISGIEPLPKSGWHKVTPGESLYEIAWRYGLDYRSLARWNGLPVSYRLQPGQIIYLYRRTNVTSVTAPKKQLVPIRKAPAVTPTVLAPPSVMREPIVIQPEEPSAPVSAWLWPAKGRVLGVFSSGRKGINIAGILGEPIYATAKGKVVYAGDGLRAYGNLVLIKHNDLFFSAYAHNQILLVKEGDWVEKGQIIAKMGESSSGQPLLYFEIRRAGKPLNPLLLLPRKGAV